MAPHLVLEKYYGSLVMQEQSGLVSYDNVNNRYYVLDTSYLQIYDSEWELLKQYENTYGDSYIGTGEMTAQSSFCYGGKFIGLYFVREIGARR